MLVRHRSTAPEMGKAAGVLDAPRSMYTSTLVSAHPCKSIVAIVITITWIPRQRSETVYISFVDGVKGQNRTAQFWFIHIPRSAILVLSIYYRLAPVAMSGRIRQSGWIGGLLILALLSLLTGTQGEPNPRFVLI
jgi:hypothetical protein